MRAKMPSPEEARRYKEEMLSMYRMRKDTTADIQPSMPKTDYQQNGGVTKEPASIAPNKDEKSVSYNAENNINPLQDEKEANTVLENPPQLPSNLQNDQSTETENEINKRYPSPLMFEPPSEEKGLNEHNQHTEGENPNVPLTNQEITDAAELDQSITEPTQQKPKGTINGGAFAPPTSNVSSPLDYDKLCREQRGSCGTWQGRIYAGNETTPIEGAIVFLSQSTFEGQALQYILTTDESGETPEVYLEAPDSSLSLTPEASPDTPPYATYNITVFADGFYPVEAGTSAIFAGVKSIQPLKLTPLQDREQVPPPHILHPAFPTTGPNYADR